MDRVPFTIKGDLVRSWGAKKAWGAYYFEIQLLNEFVSDKPLTVEEVFSKLELEDCIVRSVHVPLSNKLFRGCLQITEILDVQLGDIFEKCCQLANMIGKKQDTVVNVIVHNSMTLEDIRHAGDLYNQLVAKVSRLLNTYRNICIEIENVVPLEFDTDGLPIYQAGCLMECCKLVEAMREQLIEPERLKTVMDTVHLLQSKRTTEVITGKPFKLDSIVRYYKDTIGTVHLANCRGLGLTEKGHGCLFGTASDKATLIELLYLLQDFNAEFDVCLEVREDNYSYSANAKKFARELMSMSQVKGLIKE